jgi:uncharacterized membrane protein YphA (DoxX/SURF4 family)
VEKSSLPVTETESSSQIAEGSDPAWGRWAIVYARVALGAAFLSAVASRFGLWDRTIDMKHFAAFLQYAAQVLSFLPAAIIPFLAWAATITETSLGILLILGLWPRWASLAAAVLLAIFGASMAISLGPESPLDYSVFSASGAALLLALNAFRNGKSTIGHKKGERSS